MIFDLQLIIQGFLIGFFFSQFEPLQELITEYLKPGLLRKQNMVNKYLYNGLSCIKCCSFWTVLIIGVCNFHFNFYEACIASIIAHLFGKFLI